MKIFLQRELRAAYAHAAAGDIALHMCQSAGLVTAAAPACFQRSREFAHMFDQNYARLVAMARKFGVRNIVPQYCGTHRQHVDLCGRPFEHAIEYAHRSEELAKQRAAQPELALQ